MSNEYDQDRWIIETIVTQTKEERKVWTVNF